MNVRLLFRRVLLAVIVLLLLLMAWEAVTGAIDQFPRSETAGQKIETIIQIGFGILCVLTVITCFWRQEWADTIRIAWGTNLVLVAGLSSLVWGPPMLLATLAVVMVALGVAVIFIWALRRLTGKDYKVDSSQKPYG